MKKMTAVFLTMALAAASGSVLAGGNAAAGKAKAVTCQGCHGAKGISANPMWPNLPGQATACLQERCSQGSDHECHGQAAERCRHR